MLGLVVRTVGLDKNKFQTVICTVFDLFHQKLFMLGSKMFLKLARSCIWAKMSMKFWGGLCVGLIVGVEVVVMKNFKYFETVFEYRRQYFALILSKSFFVQNTSCIFSNLGGSGSSFFLRDPVTSFAGCIFVDFLKNVTDGCSSISIRNSRGFLI
jgi:hypothetical protein